MRIIIKKNKYKFTLIFLLSFSLILFLKFDNVVQIVNAAVNSPFQVTVRATSGGQDTIFTCTLDSSSTINTPVPSTGPTNIPTVNPTNTGSAECPQIYSPDSVWNTAITNPTYHSNSDNLITAISHKTLGSNPDAYTYPVYIVEPTTPIQTVTVQTNFYNVINNGTEIDKQPNAVLQIPIPADAQQSAGNDAQIIIIDYETGDEWAFIGANKNTDGSWLVERGYHYNIKWSGETPDGFGSRGAGVTYLAGLIRRCEIDRGYIDHAIAFAYDYPCSESICSAQGFPHYIPPATKSDGKGDYQYDFPEGVRLQLVATDAEIETWCGSDDTCKIMARALREFGMITIDNGGSAKIYPEDNKTANWGSLLTRETPNNIPLSRFKVIDF